MRKSVILILILIFFIFGCMEEEKTISSEVTSESDTAPAESEENNETDDDNDSALWVEEVSDSYEEHIESVSFIISENKKDIDLLTRKLTAYRKNNSDKIYQIKVNLIKLKKRNDYTVIEKELKKRVSPFVDSIKGFLEEKGDFVQEDTEIFKEMEQLIF